MKTGITLVLTALSALGGTGMLSDFHAPLVSSGYTPSQECVAWYDGCNMCQKEPDGSVSCTDRVCAKPGAGFCRQEATSTPQT